MSERPTIECMPNGPLRVTNLDMRKAMERLSSGSRISGNRFRIAVYFRPTRIQEWVRSCILPLGFVKRSPNVALKPT